MLVKGATGVLCNIGYPSETHLKPKSYEISFVHNIYFSRPIVFKFCKERGSDTNMLCANDQLDWIIYMDVMDEWDFARFQDYWII